MLSHRTYAEIIRLTDSVLHEIGSREAIDRITVIHGYMQLLSSPTVQPEVYEARLARAIGDLLRLAIHHGKATLAQELNELLATIGKGQKA